MSFYAKLKDQLEDNIPVKKLEELPRGYRIVGKIMLLKLRPKLVRHRKAIGKAVLELFPYIQTVCLAKVIGGVKRKPKVEVIAGCKDTRTLQREHGCQFLLDVSKIMWSQGNKEEKMRLVRMVRSNETIVDMFAGIGYFTILMARYSNPKKIYAIDINPDAIEFLKKNAWLNGVESKVEILEGDCRKFAKLLEGSADRVVMGYLFNTEKFLPYALRIAKKNAFIHLHRTAKVEEIKKLKKRLVDIGKKNGCQLNIVRVKEVKSYAPKIQHVVFDIKVKKLVKR
ncbi:MAG: class I SAM-dependent methyltransferase family protein [Candidatus Aenigmatarchaeota archaeon]